MNSASKDNSSVELKLSEASELIASGAIDSARARLFEAIDSDENNEAVWWLLATISDADDLQICLEHVLDLNPENQDAWKKLEQYSLKLFVQRKILSYGIDLSNPFRREELRAQIQELGATALAEVNILLRRAERDKLFESVIADMLGFGVLDTLLKDDSITGIYVQGKANIHVERKGKWEVTNIQFDNELHLRRTIDKIVKPLGKLVTEQFPVVNARLPDGSSVNIITPPASFKNHTLMVRKYSKTPLMIEDLIRFGSMTSEMAEFLRACVIAQVKVFVVGGAGSGKNTLINVLSGFIPNDERIITCERVAEYQLQQEHVISLESEIDIPIRMLLSHRPDRIFYGELLENQIVSFVDSVLQLPTTIGMLRARTIDGALRQLEIGLLRAAPESNLSMIRDLISRSLDIIVLTRILPDGSRRVTEIVEIISAQDGIYNNQTLFQFEQTGLENKKIIGRIRPTGNQPTFLNRFLNTGISLDPSVFGL